MGIVPTRATRPRQLINSACAIGIDAPEHGLRLVRRRRVAASEEEILELLDAQDRSRRGKPSFLLLSNSARGS